MAGRDVLGVPVKYSSASAPTQTVVPNTFDDLSWDGVSLRALASPPCFFHWRIPVDSKAFSEPPSAS